MSRCTGHCCREFPVGGPSGIDAITAPDGNVMDDDYIRDMLVPVKFDGEPGEWTFTCRHFDGENCTAYDSRPAMCRDYPYGSACQYEECTLEGRGVEPCIPVNGTDPECSAVPVGRDVTDC